MGKQILWPALKIAKFCEILDGLRDLAVMMTMMMMMMMTRGALDRGA